MAVGRLPTAHVEKVIGTLTKSRVLAWKTVRKVLDELLLPSLKVSVDLKPLACCELYKPMHFKSHSIRIDGDQRIISQCLYIIFEVAMSG